MGAPALFDHRAALGVAAGARRADDGDRATGDEVVEAPGEREAGALRLLDDRAVVAQVAWGAHRPGGGAAAAGAQGQRAAAGNERAAARGARGAVPAAPTVELPAPRRQPLCAVRGGQDARAGAVVRDGAALHEGARAFAHEGEVGHAGRRARAGAARRAGSPLLRGRVREQSLAPRLPLRPAEGAPARRPLGEAGAARHPR